MNKIKLLCLATLSLGISYASEIAPQFATLNLAVARRTATEHFRRAEDLAVQLAAAGGGALAGYVDPAPLNAQIAILTAERDNFANTVVPGLQASEAALQAQVAAAGAPFQQQITDLTLERDDFLYTVVPGLQASEAALQVQVATLQGQLNVMVTYVDPAPLNAQIANLQASELALQGQIAVLDNELRYTTQVAQQILLDKDAAAFGTLVDLYNTKNGGAYLGSVKVSLRAHLNGWIQRLLSVDGAFIVNCTTNYTRSDFIDKLNNNSQGNIIRDITWVQVVPPAQPGLNDHATFRKALVGNIAEQIEARLRAGVFDTKADGDDVLAADVAASGLLPDLTLATFLTTLKDYLNNQVI